jgi:hypothetical protein
MLPEGKSSLMNEWMEAELKMGQSYKTPITLEL